jgi:hypothetical protein
MKERRKYDWLPSIDAVVIAASSVIILAGMWIAF